MPDCNHFLPTRPRGVVWMVQIRQDELAGNHFLLFLFVLCLLFPQTCFVFRKRLHSCFFSSLFYIFEISDWSWPVFTTQTNVELCSIQLFFPAMNKNSISEVCEVFFTCLFFP